MLSKICSKFGLQCLVLVFLCTNLVACSIEKPPSIRIATTVWPGYEPLYISKSLGYLDENSFRLIDMNSASQVMRAFRNNVIDIAGLTLDEVLQLASEGAKLKIFLVTDFSTGGDAVIGQTEFKEMKDLKGGRIGAENTALGGYMLSRSLELNSLNVKDVTIIPTYSHEMERKFMSGEVDAIVTYEPTKSRVLKVRGNLLFDSKQMPGEIVDVLVIRKEVFDKRPDVIPQLVDAWYHALSYMINSPQESHDIINKRLKVGKQEIATMYENIVLPSRSENELLLNSDDAEHGLVGKIEKLTDYMMKNGLLHKRPVISQIL